MAYAAVKRSTGRSPLPANSASSAAGAQRSRRSAALPIQKGSPEEEVIVQDEREKSRNIQPAAIPAEPLVCRDGAPSVSEELPADLGDTLTYLREQCDKRTWNIIELKFRDKMVLREIAAVVGVSRERCRQLLMKQAWRMKHYYQDVAKYGIGQAMEMQQKGEIDLSVHALRVPAAAASRAVKCGFNTISQLTSVTITEIKMTPRLKNGIASVLAQGLAEWGVILPQEGHASFRQQCPSDQNSRPGSVLESKNRHVQEQHHDTRRPDYQDIRRPAGLEGGRDTRPVLITRG